jgi:AP2-like factor (ANT lineage)
VTGLDYDGGASELSMLVGSSAVGGKRAVEAETEPKLEDFLGGNSFVSEQDQAGGFLFSGVPMDSSINSNSGSNTMELSMIKSWLRNNQVPQPPYPQTVEAPAQQPQPNKEIMSTHGSASSFDALGRNSAVAATGSLALSMSTGSGSQLPMAGAGGGVSGAGGVAEGASSENKRASGAMDSPGGAVEAVARKSIDTFGQRTSIYRGVTRLERSSINC